MADAPAMKGETTVEEPTRLGQATARRMAESKATAPDTSVGAQVAMDAAAGLGTPRDLVLRAAALALREQPHANGAYRDGRFERYSRVNVGFVVTVGDGLVVPTIVDADTKPLAQVAEEAAALEQRALAGEIAAPELAGGTFTVFALDGVDRFTPVLNPPQAGILGVGALRERVVARDGAMVVAPTLDLTLTSDHRILYGEAAAAFLRRVRAHLEDPAAL